MGIPPIVPVILFVVAVALLLTALLKGPLEEAWKEQKEKWKAEVNEFIDDL